MAEKDEKAARKPRAGKSAKTGEKREGGARTKSADKPSARKTGKAARESVPKKEQAAPRAEDEERAGGRGKAAVGEAQAAAEKESVEAREEREVSEEEFHRILEESLEKVTVADIVLTMMNQLASMGYLKMGLPENVNLKDRDLDQALLAAQFRTDKAGIGSDARRTTLPPANAAGRLIPRRRRRSPARRCGLLPAPASPPPGCSSRP